MIEIADKKSCTGCGSCINVCPFHAILPIEDEEGFMYPEVDKQKCIDCHLCEKSCPMLNGHVGGIPTFNDFPKFFSGQLSNKEDLNLVSSGGAFWAFAQAVISSGGVVYGAVQRDVDNIFHVRATNLEECALIRRSKYFQSNINDTFVQVKKDLYSEITVLFSGTGCQIAGLKAFLKKDYPSLFTCDVVCHGVPSRKVWKAYRKEKEEREGKTMAGLIFRDKTIGWSNNQYKIIYTDGSVEYERSNSQLFHAGYLKGLFYRPSCGCCRFAKLPRYADTTIADYWRYKGKFHDKRVNDVGVSLISINSPKGQHLLQMSKPYLEVEEANREQALNSCRHLDEHPTENPNRDAFFKILFEKGYYAAAQQYIKKASFKTRVIRKLKRMITLFCNSF